MKRSDSTNYKKIISLKRGNYYYIKSVSQDQYLTVQKDKTGNNGKIYLTKLDQMNLLQIWMIEEISQGKFQILHPFSSLVLQLIDQNIKLKQNKIKNSQLLWVQKTLLNIEDSNTYFIKQFKESKKYVCIVQNQLMCQQQQLYLNQCNKWELEIINNHSMIQETFFIQNCRSNMVLQVFNSSTQQGQKIVQNNLNRCFHQRWSLIKNANYYIIKSLKTGFVLDIKGQKKKQGTSVIQYKNKNSQNQKWILQSHGKRIYIIRSFLDKTLMLGIKGNSLKQQSQLIITKNQAEAFWRIVGDSR